MTPYSFAGGETYGRSEFPWESFPWSEILKPTVKLPAFITPISDPFPLSTPPEPTKKEDLSPLRWLWDEAVKGWQ